MRIHLNTKEGRSVLGEDHLIPNFNEPPYVIMWGTRIFIYDPISVQSVVQYREAWVYSLPESLDGLRASNLVSDGA